MLRNRPIPLTAALVGALLAVFLAIPTADAADSLPAATSQVNITKINGSTPSATAPMPAQLSDGAAFYVGAKTGQLPSALGQTTMAASMSVAIASNQSTLPTNIAQISGTTADTNTGNATAGTMRVVLASNQPTIAVSSGVLTGMGDALGTTVNIAAGGTSTITCKGSLAISQPLKLLRARVSGAAMSRCTIQYDDNAALTKWGSIVLSPTSPTSELACPYGACALTTSATATTQAIEASCTNFDSVAQDFTCDVSYCQAASGC